MRPHRSQWIYDLAVLAIFAVLALAFTGGIPKEQPGNPDDGTIEEAPNPIAATSS